VETARYVNRCSTQGAKERWDNSILDLKIWMTKRHPHPAFMEMFLAHLSEWQHRSRRVPVNKGLYTQDLDQAQNDIRWEALLNGQVSTLWKCIQHQYYISLGKRNTGE
jgi:hypothetical protein